MVYYHTHSKNLDKCGKNPQSARRKPNYHTKCGKNCHKILSVHGWESKFGTKNVEKSIFQNFNIDIIKMTEDELH